MSTSTIDMEQSAGNAPHVAFLYEVSLSIGQSLDVAQNANHFIGAVTAHPALNSAEVWLKESLGNAGGPELILPAYPTRSESSSQRSLLSKHKLLKLLAEDSFQLLDHDKAIAWNLLSPEEPQSNQQAVYKLDQFGFLLLTVNRDFDIQALNKAGFSTLINRFSTSLHAGFKAASLPEPEPSSALSETALLEQDTLYRSVVENINEGLFITDELDRIIFANSQLEELTGYSLQEMIGKEAYKLFFPDEKFPGISVILHTREMHPEQYELQSVRKDGSKWWTRMNTSPYKDMAGRIRGTITAKADISYQKRMEKVLLESEGRYRALVESASDIIYRTDTQGHFVYANPTSLSVLQYKKKEVIGKSLMEFVLPEFKKEAQDFYEKQFSQQVHSTYFELPIVTKLGREIWLGQNVQSIIEDGRVVGFSAVSRDITERKLAQDKVRKSEEKYKSIIENMNLGLVEMDNDHQIIRAYDKFSEMVGYTPEELEHKDLGELLVHSIDRPWIKAQTQKVKLGESAVYEIRMIKKDGSFIYLLASTTPIYTDDREIVGSIAIHYDITERKKMEEDLVAARKKAEESSMAKEQFLANMSHEIRTPMNAITGMSKILADTELSEEQNSFLHAIKTSAENLSGIINDILDISKIDLGKIEIETIGFNLQRLAEDLVNSVQYKANEKKITLSYEIDENISEVIIGDPLRLNQILLNLIDNALKFTHQGNVKLSCVLDGTKGTYDRILFKVIDTGIGIGEAKLQSIFESFSQEDESITRRFGGTGLGLSICKKLVEIFGGKIEVQSTKDEGTTFSFVLPFRQGRTSDLFKEKEPQAIDQRLQGLHILLAEDHEINTFLATTILRRWGTTVDVAENGESAVRMVQENTYDLVLMDMQMPVMSGIDATKIIRERMRSRVPIIALTANARATDNAKCLEAGMNDYIAKPYRQEELFTKISSLLDIKSPSGPLQIAAPAQQASTETDVDEELESKKLYNLSKLEEMSAGDRVFVKKMIHMFLDQSPKLLESINLHYQKLEFKMLRAVAHKFKPSIDFMGIESLKEDIRLIERMAENRENSPLLAEKINKLNKVCEKVFEQIAPELSV